MFRTAQLDQSLSQQTLHNLRRVCGHRDIIPSSLLISDGLHEPNDGTFEMNQCPEVWMGEFNPVQGGANQNDVQVKVVKLGRTQKVSKSFDLGLVPWLVDVP